MIFAEAGKMALNLIKQQGLTQSTDEEAAESVVGGAIETVVGDTEQVSTAFLYQALSQANKIQHNIWWLIPFGQLKNS